MSDPHGRDAMMSAVALLDRTPYPTAHDVKAALVGNLCRCANHNRYVEAVVAVGEGRAAPADGRQSDWLGEPDPHLTSATTRDLVDALRRNLAGADVLRVVGPQWLTDADLRHDVDALVAAVRATGGRVEFVASAP